MIYIKQKAPSVVILSISKKDPGSGLLLLEQIKSNYPEIVVVTTSERNKEMIEAIRLGAYDCIDGPLNKYRLQIIIKRAIKSASYNFRPLPDQELALVGKSVAIHRLNNQIKSLANKNSRVIITGESGVGKEVVARILHSRSRNPASSFVTLNFKSGLSQLMALKNHKGDFAYKQRYDIGILYIDEITKFSLKAQEQILKLLEYQQHENKCELSFRVISSSSKNLEQAVKLGELREDLYNRLNVIPIRVPSLSERIEDIPELCEYFVNYLSRTSSLPNRAIEQDIIVAMQAYSWPGNIRQLKNIIELILATPNKSNLAHILPLENFAYSNINKDIISTPLKEAKRAFEREYLKAQINRFGGNISKTAEFIRMERAALHRRLKTLGMT
ncbi:sigma-54-dependent Fis family transcriptional regulator [Rickettsiales bacterium]|nr:sigma-54-dependent Fis family transcriptional regulator [Rickettsiales bacterium]